MKALLLLAVTVGFHSVIAVSGIYANPLSQILEVERTLLRLELSPRLPTLTRSFLLPPSALP